MTLKTMTRFVNKGAPRKLLVVVHPADDSFTMGLTRGYVAELEKLEHLHFDEITPDLLCVPLRLGA